MHNAGSSLGILRLRALLRLTKHTSSCLYVLALVIVFNLIAPSIAHASQNVPREIIGLYNGELENQKFSKLHKFIEMPLNHLGLNLSYHDVNFPLLKISEDDNIRGVIVWLEAIDGIKRPLETLQWLSDAIDKGKKVIFIGAVPIGKEDRDNPKIMLLFNKLMQKIGITDANAWEAITYDSSIVYKNQSMVEFERVFSGKVSSYPVIRINENQAKSWLTIRKRNDLSSDAHVVISHKNGGFVAKNYLIFQEEDEQGILINAQWFLNPFEYFRIIYATDDLPKPDTTTIAGRRIFYSHIDGDGWANLTELEEYRDKHTISARVVEEKVLEKYPDFPITVGGVAAELDESCYGKKKNIDVARSIYALPNVEASSHTYSHPFFWQFFEKYNPEDEVPFLSKYPHRPSEDGTLHNLFGVILGMDKLAALLDSKSESLDSKLKNSSGTPQYTHHSDYVQGEIGSYDIPRAYACAPFEIDREITQANSLINNLLPKGKKPVDLIQWSGNTWPFESMLTAVHDAGMVNINGGDSRFDREFPSYAWVAPIGMKIGNQQQIYSSNSNENTYTELWTNRFFGFRYLRRTIENTESPIRVKPFNIYYHMYSGEKQASLSAVINNYEYARTQEITPIPTSQFARIAQGFYSTQLQEISDNKWKILNRGALQTIRFDRAAFKTVDLDNSKGVVGMRHYQGSLYVYLDDFIKEPVVALMENFSYDVPAANKLPYLLNSRWTVSHLLYKNKKLAFIAAGYGKGEMHWQMPSAGKYKIDVKDSEGKVLETLTASTDKERQLSFIIMTQNFGSNLNVTVVKQGS